MGGNLFSTKRLNIEEYSQIVKEVSEIFAKKQRGISIPRTFDEKEDFGDLDVCITEPYLSDEELLEMFNLTSASDLHWNSSVVSLPYKEFQIDICHFPAEDYETACTYMQFGDLSNMIGVICNQAFAMRYTHKGLTIPIRAKREDLIDEVIISRDTQKIMEFCDLNWEKYNVGFANETEAFHWISDSKYFNPKFFEFESLNHQNRTRNRKRKMYSRFVEWCINVTGEDTSQRSMQFTLPHYPTKNMTEHLWRSILHFEDFWIGDTWPGLEKRICLAANQRKFNANDIIRLTKLEGGDLGAFIKKFKNYIQRVFVMDYDDYIYWNPKEFIETQCLNCFYDRV